MQNENFRRNREDGAFCRKCVWHFRLEHNLTGCEYHLCNDQGRGHPGGPGCPKFLRGNPRIRHNMTDPSEKNVRIRLGLDDSPMQARARKAQPKPETPQVTETDARPHKPGGKYPPQCYIPEPAPKSWHGADLNMELFLDLLRDRGGLYGLGKELGVNTGTIVRWRTAERISVPMAERIMIVYGIDVRRGAG